MPDIPIELDLQIQQVQAELLASFAKYAEMSSQYSDVLYTLEFNIQNSHKVNIFLSGLDSLDEGFQSLREAAKLIAEMRGIVVSQN
jgi:hypothetical protein